MKMRKGGGRGGGGGRGRYGHGDVTYISLLSHADTRRSLGQSVLRLIRRRSAVDRGAPCLDGLLGRESGVGVGDDGVNPFLEGENFGLADFEGGGLGRGGCGSRCCERQGESQGGDGEEVVGEHCESGRGDGSG